MSESPLLKYRSISKKDPTTQKNFQVGIVLRENGRFEVYADFMLVAEHIDLKRQCVDIDTDFNQFYFKFVINSHVVEEGDDVSKLEYEVRQARHFWRNRISFNTTKIKSDPKCWDIILHKRISAYFRLYTQVLNFSMFMLVSHRNMISVYDMSQSTHGEDEKWTNTVKFKHGIIRQMLLKERSKVEREKINHKI